MERKTKTIGAIITAGCAGIAAVAAFVRDVSEINVDNLKYIVTEVVAGETTGAQNGAVSEIISETIRQTEQILNQTTEVSEENTAADQETVETEAWTEETQTQMAKQADGYQVSTMFKCELDPCDAAVDANGTVYMVDGTYLWDSKSQEKVTVMSVTGEKEKFGNNLYYNPYEKVVYLGATRGGNDLNLYRLKDGGWECVFESSQVEALKNLTINSSYKGICGMFSDGTMVYMTDSGRVYLLDLKKEEVLGWFDLENQVPMVLNDTLYLVTEDGFEEADFTGNPIRSCPFSFGGDIDGWPNKRVRSDGKYAYFAQDHKIYIFDGSQVAEYLDLKQARYYTRMDSNFLTVRGEEILYYDYLNKAYKQITR